MHPSALDPVRRAASGERIPNGLSSVTWRETWNPGLRAMAEAKVVIVGRCEATLIETKALAGRPELVKFCLADVRQDEDIAKIADFMHREMGSVDILMNIAGVWHDETRKYHGPRVEETAAEQIREVLEVGLHGGFLLTRAPLPDLIRKNGGKILFISCGFAGPQEAVGWLHYYVTNKAIDVMTERLAAELREHEIQVNCVSPVVRCDGSSETFLSG